MSEAGRESEFLQLLLVMLLDISNHSRFHPHLFAATRDTLPLSLPSSNAPAEGSSLGTDSAVYLSLVGFKL